MTAIRPPAHVAPFVAALGEAKAIEFLIAFGGAPVYVAGRPQATNMMLPVIGETGIAALHRHFGSRIDRVPTAKTWIARVWYAAGRPVVEIARALHVTDKTVRAWLVDDRAEVIARAEAQRERRAEERARQIDIVDWLEDRAG